MARLGNNGSGKTDWYGSFGTILRKIMIGEVIEGLAVEAKPSPNMSVSVLPGTVAIPTGSAPAENALLGRIDTSGGESVAIATANSSNPRNDIVVLFYDAAVINNTTPNNPGSVKVIAVAGTPAASPADPNASAIQAAIAAAGASSSSPYVILARVRVNASVTQITNANVTDLRTPASARLAPKVVTADKTDFGGSFSTSEVNTGFTFVDGKAIYKKSVLINFTTGNASLTFAHGITNLDRFVELQCLVGGVKHPFYVNTGFFRYLTASSTNIFIEQSGNSLPSGPNYVTLYYTKV